jgi:hypothetical protein
MGELAYNLDGMFAATCAVVGTNGGELADKLDGFFAATDDGNDEGFSSCIAT